MGSSAWKNGKAHRARIEDRYAPVHDLLLDMRVTAEDEGTGAFFHEQERFRIIRKQRLIDGSSREKKVRSLSDRRR